MKNWDSWSKIQQPEKVTTVLLDQTQQAPSRNQLKLIVFDFLLQVHDKTAISDIF